MLAPSLGWRGFCPLFLALTALFLSCTQSKFMEIESFVRREFVREKLTSEGQDMLDDQSRAIRKYLNYRTGHLMNDRTMKVSSSDDMDGDLHFTIPAYGRFLDIAPKNRTRKNTSNFDYWKKRKARNSSFAIYNRYVFGLYYGLAYRLRYGLTEEIATAIKANFIKEI